MVLLLAAMVAIALLALLAGAVARGFGLRADAQRAADLAALAGAKAMREAFGRLFEPPLVDGAPNPAHLSREAYLALGVEAAEGAAENNGADDVAVTFPAADPLAPTRIRVAVRDRIEVRGGGSVDPKVAAEAELVPPSVGPVSAAAGQYSGALAYRDGSPMRPDVAMAYDRMAAAARADGVALSVSSGFRSDAEQAVLWARNPDPKWVARPGTSLHRLGTELDLGPESAYGWLAANAGRFGFVQRYSWEPWHYEAR